MALPAVHYVMDVKTGFVYGLMLDEAGHCLKVQALDASLQTQTGTLVKKFSPVSARVRPDGIPYGETIFAVEVGAEEGTGKLFTLSFPKEKGSLPVIRTKDLPSSMTQSGFAAPPVAFRDTDRASFQEAMVPIDKMIGMTEPKKQILKHAAKIELDRAKQEMGLPVHKSSHHMALMGAPGTGKTTFARHLTNAYYAAGIIAEPKMVELSQDIVSKFVGDTALKVQETFEKAKGGVLFIDEFYSLVSGEGGNASTHHEQAVNMITALLDNVREDTIVIVAGYGPAMEKALASNQGLNSRFPLKINFEDYTNEQLGQIFDSMIADRGYTAAPEVRENALHRLQLEKVLYGPLFANARSVRNLVEAIEDEHGLRLKNEGVLGGKQTMDPVLYAEKIKTITLDDIRDIPLPKLIKPVQAHNEVGFKRPQPPSATPMAA